ncbi:MAG: serine hydrolase [Planctomycetia bacterium]|nr:serine hydrolase [Planctomycetia bacterium]
MNSIAFPLVIAVANLLAEPIFPGEAWEPKTPAQVGLDATALKAFSDYVGGRGCVVRHGCLVYTWGDAAQRGDVASAAKPVYAHLLFKAIEDGKIVGLDEKIVKWEPRLADINKSLGFKDRDIAWQHLATQTSCYGVADKPGSAFCYNDWQMALFFDTLFLKVYGATHDTVDEKVFRPLLADPLGCQDEPTMMAFGKGDRAGRLAISPRDFARFGLLYLRKGDWNGKPLISAKHAALAVTSPLPNSIPRSEGNAAEMLTGQRSIGSQKVPDNQTDHFGSYSFLWWTNGRDREGTRMWPDAPADAFGAFGHGGPRALVVIPSLDIVVSYNDAKLEGWASGKENPTNRAMKLLVEAVRKE